jgi:5-methyltetrahydropteroyltriglutamate--homocysteine methyltransferase
MKDIIRYPSFLELKLPEFSRTMVSLMNAPMAVGEVRYVDRSPLEKECADFLRIAGEQGRCFTEAFMTAASPGIVASAMLNEYYPRYEDYVFAVADALKTEYEYIAGQGLVLQIDCPDLAMERHTSFAERPLDDFLSFVDLNIAAINRAVARIPLDRIRMHVCWGNYEGPHTRDIAMSKILPIALKAKPMALLIEGANPRHEHEWELWKTAQLPQDKILIPGVIGSNTNYVEHPEVVADRIERAAEAIGDPHRILAGTDCGFDTAAGLGEVAEEVVWEKLKALREGADIASRRLFA